MPAVVFEKHGHYGSIRIDRPEALNAINTEVRQGLADGVAAVTNDPEIRVGILTGTGRAFSAGADLKEMAQRGRVTGTGTSGQALDSMPFSNCPKPFIAAVNGLAFGGGFERAMDCDIRVCSTAAEFGLLEVKRGILAGYGIHHLPRLIPFGEAMYIMLTGDRISAQDALRVGIVHQVLEPDELLPRAIEIADMIAANAPLSIEGSKAMGQLWRKAMMGESQRLSTWVSRVVVNSDDAKEGPRAFSEKRAPVWQGH